MSGTDARDSAREWLLLRLAQCMAEPMSERTADRLAVYYGAYSALCQWEDAKPAASSAFDRKMAEAWTAKMENEDGSRGPHWTLDQAKQVMEQRNIDCDPLQFWVALNMMYSDYVKVAKKYGAGDKIDFYADMARAFLEDKDAGAGKDKLARYYEYIVK